jgi:O-antigen/teichoic acid export membrane protein
MYQKLKIFLFDNISEQQTIAKNTFWLFFSEVISRLLKFFLVFYAARSLGVFGWGIFSYIIAFASIFTSFADIGLNTLVIKEFSVDTGKSFNYFSTAFYIKIFWFLLSSIIIFILIPLSKIQINTSLIIFVLLFLFSDSLREFLMSVNRAAERMELEAYLKIISNVLIVFFGIFFVLFYKTPSSLAFGYFIGSILGLLISFLSLSGYRYKIIGSFSKNLLPTIIKSAWPIAISMAVNTVALSIDTIALGYFKGPIEVGLYSAAQRVIMFLYVIPLFLVTSLLPVISRYAKTDKEKLAFLFKKSAKLFFILSLVVVIFGIVFAKFIILLGFGQDYLGAVSAFRMLLLLIPAAFINFLVIYTAIALNLQKKLLWGNVSGLALNIALNIILVPKYGIFGAAIAVVITLNCLVLICWNELRKAM